MSSVADGHGAALKNEASEVLTLSESLGPVSLAVTNLGTSNVVVSVEDKETGALVALEEDTAVSGEDTAYDGDTSTLDFSGEALNNVPIIPKSVTVKPTAGGNSVNLIDRDGDGKLYTDDVDEDEAGTIDYFTGDLVLNFPTGKAPNTTNITADYSYQDKVTVPSGKRSLKVSNLPPEKVLVVKAASASGSQVRVEAFQSF